MTGVEAELPTGTVTFLLTDVERSTELVARLGERWPAVAGEHRRLLRAAVAEAGGHEVDARGEEFLFVFRRAQGAVVAAAAGQRALAAHPWPPEAVVRVRMGLHTGEPAVGDDGGYLGLDVHRVARICAAGHGGQVLCSAVTQAIVGSSGLGFVDLGEQRVKGLERPERVFQLVAPGLPRQFPPLRSVAVAPFEGSERELGAAALGRVRAHIRHLPSLRRRVSPARRAADLCFALRATLPGTPEADRQAVTELARAFVELSRIAGDVDRYLGRIDRRALAKNLAEARELGVLSKQAAQRTAKLERQLALVDAVAQARRELEERLDELERKAMSSDRSEAEAVGQEVEALRTRLADAVDDAIQQVGDVAERLRRTWHRGVYRQGETWIVPHYDSVGVQHLTRFDQLKDARQFAASKRVEQKLAQSAELSPVWSEKNPSNTGQAG